MKGNILDYTSETRSGIISGDDGNRYSFRSADWRAQTRPAVNMRVDFETIGSNAMNIYLLQESRAADPFASNKDRTTAALLAIFLGGLGIHKFYLGYKGSGLVYLLVNTIGIAILWIVFYLPNIALGIIAFVEGIIYLTKTDEEFYQTYVKGRKDWF